MRKIIIYLGIVLVFLALFISGIIIGKESALKSIHDYYQPELSQSYINNLALKDSIAKLNFKIEDLKTWCK